MTCGWEWIGLDISPACVNLASHVITCRSAYLAGSSEICMPLGHALLHELGYSYSYLTRGKDLPGVCVGGGGGRVRIKRCRKL